MVANIQALAAYGTLEEIVHERYMSEFMEQAFEGCEAILLNIISLDNNPSITMVATSYGYTKAPETYKEARMRTDWVMFKGAMSREYNSLVKMNTFDACELPEGRKAIDICWVFAFK